MQKGKYQQIFYKFLKSYSNEEHILIDKDNNRLLFEIFFEFCSD